MGGGRQRAFDSQAALNQAMQLFWMKGYLGASLTELTQVMGINKPSMYAAFGNKEQLFIQATQQYIERHAEPHTRLLHEEGCTLTKRLQNYLNAIVETQSGIAGPTGCYLSLCLSEMASGHIPSAASQAITEARDFHERYLTKFFAAEIKQGNLSSTAQPDVLALSILTLMNGTATLTRINKSLDELTPVLNQAIAALIEHYSATT